MYASVRKYEVSDNAEFRKRVQDEFVPIISQAPGFVAYYLIEADAGVTASVSIFQDKAGAEESNRLAADWVKQRVTELVKGAPQITAGEMTVTKWLGM